MTLLECITGQAIKMKGTIAKQNQLIWILVYRLAGYKHISPI